MNSLPPHIKGPPQYKLGKRFYRLGVFLSLPPFLRDLAPALALASALAFAPALALTPEPPKAN